MSWLGEAFSYFRRLTLLDHKVGQMSSAVDSMRIELTDHDRRLIRIETIIELNTRPISPPQPRLPRS